jgi:cell division topological specificity factor
MNFVVRLFGRRRATARIAKERLHLVLAHDRVYLSPDKFEMLKDEILTAISKHVAIDRDHVAFTVSRGPGGNRLVADIPVLRPPNPLKGVPSKRSVSTPKARKTG